MPPRRRQSAPSLDIEGLRAAVTAGRLVRVRIAPSSQFPDGATGRVRSIGDPAVDGAEFLSVEVGAGASKDVLPFAPEDLLRWTRQKVSAEASAVPAKPAAVRPVRTRSPRSTPGTPALPPETPPAGTDPAASDDTTRTPASPAETAESSPPPPPRIRQPTTRTTGRTAVPRRTAVSITIGTDGETGWKVEARIGSRIAVRSAAVSPARVADIARQLGEPRLIAAIDGLLAEHRKTVQAKADALAAELAALRTELDDLPPR